MRLILLLLFFISATCCNANGFADTMIMKTHLTKLTKTKQYRNHKNVGQLDSIGAYIQTVFKQYSKEVTTQEFKVDGLTYRNIICSFGTSNTQTIIVGAHYDVAGNQQGADDNASGVTGLLELARLLKEKKLNYRIDLVAYSLEEPPHFGTKDMGSYIHARALSDTKRNVFGMVSLEMIGYFSDVEGSQKYPDERLSKMYGNKGDFIGLIKSTTAGTFSNEFCKKFLAAKTVKAIEIGLPPTVEGVSYSDHRNYWKFNFDALMITDTSFFRNPNYHASTDTMETLDLNRMAKTIDGVLGALTSL